MFAGGFVLAAFAMITIGVGLGVAGYLWTAPTPQVSDAIDAATGRRSAETMPQTDDSAWSDADLRQCSEEAEAAARAASSRWLAAVSANRVGLGGPDAAMMKRATYLLCNARTKPRHLCQDYWHRSLVDAIKSYAVEIRQVRAAAYWTKVNLAERARNEARANGEAIRAFADDLDQTTRELAKTHEEIVVAIRALVTEGILKPDEFSVFFGFGISPDIGAILGNAKPVRNVCG